MKKLTKTIVTLMLIVLGIGSASAVTVDGNPAEWGPSGFLTGDWSNNATWVPNSGILFIVEDNYNPSSGKTPVGVHIRGSGSNYIYYNEPMVTHKDGYDVWEPWGGEAYDIEAMYFQQDADNIYILVVTSLAPDGTGEQTPGDLRIDIDKSDFSGDGYRYEMGVKLGTYAYSATLDQFGIYDVSEWSEVYDYIPVNMPGVIEAGTKVDDAAGSYVTCGSCNSGSGIDQGQLIYIVELSIPKSALGLESGESVNFGDITLTDRCTNDVINIPEFMTILIPIGIVLGIVFYYRRR